MVKRPRLSSLSDASPTKKPRRGSSESLDAVAYVYESPDIVATSQAAARVDEDPPLNQLVAALEENKTLKVGPGKAVVYWMRMEDMRTSDNKALALASGTAQTQGLPLIVLFALTSQEYKIHGRSVRRIDFVLRNLAMLKSEFAALHIPLYIHTHSGRRRDLPEKLLKLLESWNVTQLFANMEYEVDELRRDLTVLEKGRDRTHKVKPTFVHDRCVVEPGMVANKQGKAYSVYTPWSKAWLGIIQSRPDLFDPYPDPDPNDPSIKEHELYGTLFDSPVPTSLEGFICEDAAHMNTIWPAGTKAAMSFLVRFLQTKARSSQCSMDTLPPAVEKAKPKPKAQTRETRLGAYANQRDRADLDSSSRLSPYLSAGVISARECIRHAIAFQGKRDVRYVDLKRDDGAGMWMSEVGWRDFYNHVMAAYPRVSMGRPFQEKYADVRWEVDPALFEAWKQGKTGVPIVDAAMRMLNERGWMHNRLRMITAMYLTKDLMLDWRLGEQYFMSQLIDGDLASNNGGWQWSASTGVDPQPYFRVFNPYTQSEKADPSGDLIRRFVPELKGLSGKAIHDPFSHLDKAAFKKLKYPEPIVDHKLARERVMRRYKNPGDD
ncbi:hypothetical protein BOTBODRAFT_100395 [Botryobasidium botryosum FD-172 SS1]|uniref:Photolyase/cryptochrome alpha/beta domain-containing protein n=1 Tax=Botryobasidium botryosum (strain FD-172 SS1) TaxID=930990 RepID=A0A067MYQ7_BOTB1|nr:hypothetical protein BOTBODRAFT_100395 [Botryobasidium botryosum FD-172 SS1]